MLMRGRAKGWARGELGCLAEGLSPRRGLRDGRYETCVHVWEGGWIAEMGVRSRCVRDPRRQGCFRQARTEHCVSCRSSRRTLVLNRVLLRVLWWSLSLGRAGQWSASRS